MTQALYEALDYAAGLDFMAAKILAERECYAPSLFYLQQTLEKATKALYVHYRRTQDHISEEQILKEVKNKLGHENRDIVADLLTRLAKMMKPSNDVNLPALPDLIVKFQKAKIQTHKLISEYSDMITTLYDTYKTDFKSTFKNQLVAVYILGVILSVCLSSIEYSSRYPLKEYDFKNVEMLNDAKNKTACKQIIEMMQDFHIAVKESLMK